MKITKYGHCCLMLEINGKKILTDPGAYDYSKLPEDIKGVSAVLITHEHSDHLHVESLQNLLKNNIEAVVITNASVGKILEEAGIAYIKIEEGEKYDLDGVNISGFGNLHAEIYFTFGQVQNTGYMIDGLCYPGDAFQYPDAHVDILALPVAGPWMKIKDAIDYAKNINPRVVFPVHDGMIQSFATFPYTIPQKFLGELGIEFKKLKIGEAEEI